MHIKCYTSLPLLPTCCTRPKVREGGACDIDMNLHTLKKKVHARRTRGLKEDTSPFCLYTARCGDPSWILKEETQGRENGGFFRP